jgi:alkylation response protein AidB-like acyl-CoA dehydrogenase
MPSRQRSGHRLSNLEGGRIGMAAQAVGIARIAFEAALAYARARKQSGELIEEFDSISNMLADMQISVSAASNSWQLRTSG